MRIEICGGIASGKTTLCQTLGGHSIETVREKFHDNPFFEDYYNNPSKFAFETELTFLLQHYHDIKIASILARSVSDFSLVQDLAYADLNLSGKRHNIFCEIEKELRDEIGFPDLLIHLICPADVLLRRIQARNRDAEKNITVEYLDALNSSLENRVKFIKPKIQVVALNSNDVDFRITLPKLSELNRLIV